MAPAEIQTSALGAYLRARREAAGSSLEDMARSTRVGIRHLEALEEERLADLPSPVFVRGFIRAYCGFLRESPDPALSRYETLLGQRTSTQAATALPGPRATWASSSVLVGLALLVILGVALIVVNLIVKRTGGTSVAAPKFEVSAPYAPPPVAPVPAPAASAAAPAKPAVVPAPPAAPPPPAHSSAGAQRLTMKAVEPTWIRVQPDEGRPIEELLPAGASREWSAERRFLVTIGNAGGVEITLNGKPLPPLGAKGSVIQRLELPQAPASGS